MTLHVAPSTLPVTRPALRYPGGKWALAPWVISHLPPHRTYVEPFGGAASVLLRKPLSHEEVYNDLDDRIVNMMRVLRHPTARLDLIDQLRLTPYAENEFEACYEVSEHPVEDARRMAVLAAQSFSPVAATRRVSSFQDATGSNKFGPHSWQSYPDALPAVCHRLQRVAITRQPAFDVIRRHDGIDTLYYVDPPYLPSTRSGREARDYRNEMTEDDHRELLAVLKGVAGMVVLSGYPSELYDDALDGWMRVERQAFTHSAKAATEVLWINPAASSRLSRQTQSDLFAGASS